ncbi:MAG: drug/metabolite transporter (DMT)-like permease, partial [Arenicella sp.]
VILMAWLFLKEELKPRKILGVAIAFTGVVVFIVA